MIIKKDVIASEAKQSVMTDCFVAALLAMTALLALPQLVAAVQTPIYTVFSDNGIAGQDIFVFGPGGGNSVTLSSTAVPAGGVVPEGIYSMKAQVNSGATSTWGIFYLNQDRSNRTVDLSAYNNGEIRFWAYCNSDNFNVWMQHFDGSQDGYDYAGTFGGLFNQWVPVIFPIGPITASFPITDIDSPFEIEGNQNLTCFIDNVRYVNPSSVQADIFNVAVKTITTQAPAAGFTWPGGVAPTGWALSNEYIELQVDNLQNLAWGVQIYTNNKSASANPAYSGAVGTNPAGLIDTSNHSYTIPLAWSIKSSTQSAAAWSPTPADPNNSSDLNSFQWLFMKDAQTPTITSQNTTAFQNGDPFVTIKNNVGIHFGQRTTDFGAANPPNYLFLEANFGAGLAQHTYQTNTVTVEYFSL